MKQKEFETQVEKFDKFFNAGIYSETAQRSKECTAGRLEIYLQLYKGKLGAHIFTHPNETPFESEVLCKEVKTVSEGVRLLKKEELKLARKKTWWE